MQKNSIIIITIVGVLVLAGVGYAFYKNSQPAQVVDQNSTDTTSSATNTTDNAIPATLPTVETNSSAAPYISTVVVKGSVNPNGALTTYWYEYGTASSLGAKTKEYSVGSGFTTIYAPAYIIGLQANTDYSFRLSASNSLGTVNGATFTFRTNTIADPIGDTPTATTSAATNIENTMASLRGQVNPHSSQATFWFEYGLTPALGSVTAFQSAGDTNSSVPISVSLSNLQPLTKYYFRINAQNQFGTDNGQVLNFTTKK